MISIQQGSNSGRKQENTLFKGTVYFILCDPLVQKCSFVKHFKLVVCFYKQARKFKIIKTIILRRNV